MVEVLILFAIMVLFIVLVAAFFGALSSGGKKAKERQRAAREEAELAEEQRKLAVEVMARAVAIDAEARRVASLDEFVCKACGDSKLQKKGQNGMLKWLDSCESCGARNSFVSASSPLGKRLRAQWDEKQK